MNIEIKDLKKRYILGIDPSINYTGWCVISTDLISEKFKVENCGLITTNEANCNIKSLAILTKKFYEVLSQNKFDDVAIESSYVNINPISSLKLARAIGCIISVVSTYNSNITEYTPKSVKTRFCGNGNACKDDIKNTIKQILNVIVDNEHVADSIAIAICHYYSTSANNTAV